MKDDLTTRAMSGMLKRFAEPADAAQDDPVEEGVVYDIAMTHARHENRSVKS